ncbi:MAG: hypothetical protein V3V05_10770 [Pontiella sp.]
MMELPSILAVWEKPEFVNDLKKAIAELGNELPLQAGLSTGSYAMEEPLDVMVISTSEIDESTEVKAGIFYESLTPGCACAGDPTVESENTEHITVLVSIDKQTAEATFQLLEE